MYRKTQQRISRIERAGVALTAYRRLPGVEQDTKIQVSHLMTDLLHFADHAGMNVTQLIRTSEIHFDIERRPRQCGKE